VQDPMFLKRDHLERIFFRKSLDNDAAKTPCLMMKMTTTTTTMMMIKNTSD